MRTEKQIIAAFENNDFTALEDLYLLYAEALCKYAFRYVYDDAEEVVHDVFTKMVEQKERLQGIEPLRPFLYRSVYNACINRINHNKVKNKYVDETQYKLAQIFLEDDEEIEGPELDRYVAEAIAELPDKAREIFEMKYVKGMKTGEIADQLGIGKKTVDTHVYRGIKKLQLKLKHLFPAVILLLGIKFWPIL